MDLVPVQSRHTSAEITSDAASCYRPCANAKNRERSARGFSEALKLEPRNVNIVLGRAACYMLTRQFDPALADIDQALEIEPNNVRSNIVFFSGAPPGCW